MIYLATYDSPLGPLIIEAKEEGLLGLSYEGQKYELADLAPTENSHWLLDRTRAWLDIYFSGQEPQVQLPLLIEGTAFQKEVWGLLRTIPYGELRTYKELAQELAKKRGIKAMSAQAVGTALGKNPFSIILPCHRVIGSDGRLRGYAGGLDRKAYLLDLEQGRRGKHPAWESKSS